MRIAMALLIAACATTIVGCGDSGQPQDPESKPAGFLPVTLALGCPAKGAPSGSVFFSDAPDVQAPSGATQECVDRGKIARDLIPLDIRAINNEHMQEWQVVIKFAPHDAAKMLQLTTNAQGRRFLVAVDQQVVRAATAYGAITGDQLKLDAHSKTAAEQLVARFLKTDAAAPQ